MAIARVNWDNVLSDSNNTDTYTTSGFDVAGGSTNVLVAVVQTLTDTGGAPDWGGRTTTVFNGQAMTLAAFATWGLSTRPGCAIYYLVNPTAVTGGTATITFRDDTDASTSMRACAVTLFELSGVDQASPLNDAVGTDGANTIDLTLDADDCFVLVGVNTRGGGDGPFTPVSSTELLDDDTGSLNFNDTSYFVGQYEAGTDRTPTVGATVSEGQTSAVAAAFRPAASSPAPITGTASGDVSLSGDATGDAEVDAKASGDVALGGSSDARTDIDAIATGDLVFGGSGAAAVEIAADADGALTLGGSSGAAVAVDAVGAGSIGLSGSADAGATVGGQASVAVSFGGAGRVDVATSGSASGNLSLSGSSAATSVTSATASASIAFAGSATSATPIQGAATGSLAFDGDS